MGINVICWQWRISWFWNPQRFCFLSFLLLTYHVKCVIIRWRVKLIYHTFAPVIIGLQNLFLVRQNILHQSIYGLLVVFLLSYFLDRFHHSLAGVEDCQFHIFGYYDLWYFFFFFLLSRQPLFPGENAVDQLVEIIKVCFFCSILQSRKDITLFITCIDNMPFFSIRFLVLPHEKKFDVWIPIIQISGFPRLKPIPGTRYYY